MVTALVVKNVYYYLLPAGYERVNVYGIDLTMNLDNELKMNSVTGQFLNGVLVHDVDVNQAVMDGMTIKTLFQVDLENETLYAHSAPFAVWLAPQYGLDIAGPKGWPLVRASKPPDNLISLQAALGIGAATRKRARTVSTDQPVIPPAVTQLYAMIGLEGMTPKIYTDLLACQFIDGKTLIKVLGKSGATFEKTTLLNMTVAVKQYSIEKNPRVGYEARMYERTTALFLAKTTPNLIPLIASSVRCAGGQGAIVTPWLPATTMKINKEDKQFLTLWDFQAFMYKKGDGIIDFITHVFTVLFTAEILSSNRIAHNDLHFDNVLLTTKFKSETPVLTYVVDEWTVHVKSPAVARVFDYDLSTAEDDKNTDIKHKLLTNEYVIYKDHAQVLCQAIRMGPPMLINRLLAMVAKDAPNHLFLRSEIIPTQGMTDLGKFLTQQKFCHFIEFHQADWLRNNTNIQLFLPRLAHYLALFTKKNMQEGSNVYRVTTEPLQKEFLS